MSDAETVDTVNNIPEDPEVRAWVRSAPLCPNCGWRITTTYGGWSGEFAWPQCGNVGKCPNAKPTENVPMED